MATFEPPVADTTEDAAITRILDALATAMPGWIPREGSLDTALAEEIGRETALVAATAVDAYSSAIAAMGESVFGIPVQTGIAATLPVTFSVTAAGITVPAGFTVLGRTAAGDDAVFALPEAVTSAGASVTAVLVATSVGATSNAVPAGQSLTVLTVAPGVGAAVAGAGGSTGGIDAETKDAYLTRLTERLSILHPAGVLAADLATYVVTAVPGVTRALAIDNYDAQTATTGAERTVSIYALDSAGQNITGSTLTAAVAALNAVREANLIVRTPATGAAVAYQQLTVVFDGVATSGSTPSLVRDAVASVLRDYLSPASWGRLPDDPYAWVDRPVVRIIDLLRAVGDVAGLASLTSLTINGAAADLTLTAGGARVVLPKAFAGVAGPSTVTGTIS